MNLNEELEVYGAPWNETGYTSNGDMEKGFDYIEDHLGNRLFNKEHWRSHQTSVRKARSYIMNEARPALLKTPGHFCVLAGFLPNPNSNSIDRQWLYILTGWSSPSTAYLSSQHLEQIWYTRRINPRTMNHFNISMRDGMSMCNMVSQGSSPAPPPLWMFWLAQNRTIQYMHSGQANPFVPLSPATKATLNVQAKFTPSVTSSGNSIYLVYLDPNNKIHLMQYYWPKRSWQELPLPNIHSDVQPAIVGGNSDWLAIAFSDQENGVQFVTTNKDVQRPGAWPNSIHITGEVYPGQQCYWFPLGEIHWRADQNISMCRYEGYTVITWDNGSNWWCWKPNAQSSGLLGYTLEPDNVHRQFDCPSFAVVNGELLVTHRDESGRVFIHEVTFMWPNSRPSMFPGQTARVALSESARLEETCTGKPALGAFGSNVMAAWKDPSGKAISYKLSMDTYFHPINYAGMPR